MPMNIEELQVHGSAIVTAVDECLEIASGEGSVVTARFITREVNTIVRAEIIGPDGTIELFEGTPIHPIWSLDRNDWVPLGELIEGETLQAAGGIATVLSLALVTCSLPVYNIEVHGEHVYQVGELGLLVHNAYPNIAPNVTDSKLRNLVSDLFKGTKTPNPLGTGSTADAVRNELLTGLPTHGRFHSQKAQEYVNALTNWLKKNPNASHHDQLVARSLIDDLRAALGGELMMSTISFCERLCEQVTVARPILNEHLADYDELLPHVFLGQITRHVLSDKPGRSQIVDFLENNFHKLGPEIEELIAVSFIENIETEYDLEQATRGVSAEHLKAEWRRQKQRDR
ncbi:polymorphic toxin-type HINT domain-containing protein [Pirellulaceae bacterium SH449]